MVRYTNLPFAFAQSPAHRRFNLSSLKATVQTHSISKDTKRTDFKHWCVVDNVDCVAGFCNVGIAFHHIRFKVIWKKRFLGYEAPQPDRRKGWEGLVPGQGE